jgi:hypothetical protein
VNSIEDRLSAAAHAAASTVADGSAPPLRLPERGSPRWLRSPRPGSPRSAGPRRRMVLAPVAAAVAVAAVVVAAVAVRSDAGPDHGKNGGQSAARLAHAAPPNFVALAHVGRYGPARARTAVAVVGDTVTGRILARVAVPAPYNAFVAVSGAANDRTFVLAAQRLPAPPARRLTALADPPTRFYQLTIRSGHRSVLTALPVPVLPAGSFDAYDAIALSPDGTRLAVQLSPPTAHTRDSIRVYDLATGSHQTWYLPRNLTSASPGINSPSWVAGDRFLAVWVYTRKPRSCTAGCVRLLDTAAPQGNVLAASTIIFRPAKLHRLVGWSNLLATPDGSQLVIAGMAGKKLGSGYYEYFLPVVYDFAARSGRVTSRITGQRGVNLFPMWVSANATVLILARPNADLIGSVSAAIYGRKGTFEVRLPGQTLDVAW